MIPLIFPLEKTKDGATGTPKIPAQSEMQFSALPLQHRMTAHTDSGAASIALIAVTRW
jgi:hypothetical protein